jgi:hypothetical protein
MTRRTRSLTAVALIGMWAAAVGLLVAGLSEARSVPRSLQVSFDFAPFVVGVPQSVASPVSVPVRSDVREAGVVRAGGLAADIEWAFELCDGAGCRPLASDAVIEPGDYTVSVSGLLPADERAGDRADDPDSVAGVPGGGTVLGQIVLTELPDSSPSPVPLEWMAPLVAGGVLVVLASPVVRRRRVRVAA